MKAYTSPPIPLSRVSAGEHNGRGANGALHQGLAWLVDFKNGVRQQVAWSTFGPRFYTTTHEFRHHPSISTKVNYHLYRHQVMCSVFN
jgi:hypothetical protein